MKKGLLRGGCGLVAAIVLLLVLLGGAWWYFSGQFTTVNAPAPSVVQVFLLSPVSGDEVAVGDFVPVSLQAAAPEAIAWSEVFVDGVSLGAVTDSPDRTSWTWQAWPAGVHVLSGRAQAGDGQIGESQTVIINVLALDDEFQAQAEAGQTLGDVGAKFGVPPAQMAGANPTIDPSKPLSESQPVNVPTGGGAGTGQTQPPSGGSAGSGGGSAPFSIKWELKLTGPVDQSYCYLSDGGGNWDKMPKQPFEFFGGLDNLYTQVFDVTPPGEVTIQAQCWGWLGGALKYLGQAQTTSATSDPIQLVGSGFQLAGIPSWPEGKPVPMTGGGDQPTILPPYAVREAKDAADCASHAHPILGGFVCNTLMNAPVKQHFILEWEWHPAWPPGNPAFLDEIDGYEIYEIIPDTEGLKLMKVVKPAASKVAALPLWSATPCYGVKAYAEGPEYGGKVESEMATNCSGKEPKTSFQVFKPVSWLTTNGVSSMSGCKALGGLEGYVAANKQTGFGNKPGQVMVGSRIIDNLDILDYCQMQETHSGAVKFKLSSGPATGAVFQTATLVYSVAFQQYSAIGTSGKYKFNCAGSLSAAKKDWTGAAQSSHYGIPDWLNTTGYSKPITSLGVFDPVPVDVSAVVGDWLKNPANNHGFILNPIGASKALIDDGGVCQTGFEDFTLIVDYYVP